MPPPSILNLLFLALAHNPPTYCSLLTEDVGKQGCGVNLAHVAVWRSGTAEHTPMTIHCVCWWPQKAGNGGPWAALSVPLHWGRSSIYNVPESCFFCLSLHLHL